MFAALKFSSLPGSFDEKLASAVALGFTQVELTGKGDRPLSDLESLATSGLLVASVELGLDSGMADLGAVNRSGRRAAVDTLKAQLADAGRLGATVATLMTALDADHAALDRLADSCAVLADYAGHRMITLHVGHLHADPLPLLAWLNRPELARVRLLLELGRCGKDGTGLSELIQHVNGRLGCVLLTSDGTTGDQLRSCLTTLVRAKYQGQITLVDSGSGPESLAVLERTRQLLAQSQ